MCEHDAANLASIEGLRPAEAEACVRHVETVVEALTVVDAASLASIEGIVSWSRHEIVRTRA